MAGEPVTISKSMIVHALINHNRIGCYQPFLSFSPVTPALMIERGLTACRYCWPRGIVWPESGK